MADKVTALTAAQATTAALFARANGGGGQEVKLSMLGASIAFLWPDHAVDDHFVGSEGVVRAPAMSDFCRIFPFADGHAAFTVSSDTAFRNICAMFGSAAADDARLQTTSQRLREAELMARVEDEWAIASRTMPVDEAIATLTGWDVPCAKVLSVSDLPDHPQVRANGYLRTVEHPHSGIIREPRPAATFSATPAQPPAPAPDLGEHTAEILAELGMAGRTAELRAEGAFG